MSEDRKPVLKLNHRDMLRVMRAMEDIHNYLTDNSCCDPDCCGGPFYTFEEYESGLETLAEFGIEYEQGTLHDD